MSDNKEIKVDKVVKDSYVRWDVPMITIFNPFEEGGKVAAAKRDRGDEINILMYVTNILNLRLNQNPELSELAIPVKYSEFSNMLRWQPIQDEKLRIGDLMEVIKKINGINLILQMRTNKRNPMTSLYIYSKIDVTDWNSKDAIFNIKLNPDFIEYYKGVRNRKDNYFKLTLDVMLSLSTRGSKIVYAYISAYFDQMSKNVNNGGYYSTNETNIDELKMYLDTKRKIDKNGNIVFKMTAKQLTDNVNRALEQINEVIKEKSEKYGEYYPIYKVEWIRENPNAIKGKESKVIAFRFSIDMKYEKENKNKYKSKSTEPTVAEIINNSPFTQAAKDKIFDWYKCQNDELNACISKKELQQSIDNLSNYNEEEQIDLISKAIAYNYRVIARSQEDIKSMKCNQPKQSKPEFNFNKHNERQGTDTTNRRRK